MAPAKLVEGRSRVPDCFFRIFSSPQWQGGRGWERGRGRESVRRRRAISNVTMSPGIRSYKVIFPSLLFLSRTLARRIFPVKLKSAAKPSLLRMTPFEARLCSSSTWITNVTTSPSVTYDVLWHCARILLA